MQFSPQALASWTSLLGAIATLLGLIQSRGWLTAVGAIFICASIAAIVYARQQRLRVVGASIEIEGISIDAVNAANLRRRVNRSLFIQSVEQNVTIDGADLDMSWRYAGYCRAARETAMEFSVDSGNSTPFERLDCFAYDLTRDPEMKHKISPLLIGPDSISKKIAVPFLEPLLAQQPFDIMLHSRLPSTYKPGIGYYTSTLSFDQNRIGHCAVHLMFLRDKPEWVRVYQCDDAGRVHLVKNLQPMRERPEWTEYRDVTENLRARSARIYLFQRTET
jgi:hypothetical protein